MSSSSRRFLRDACLFAVPVIIGLAALEARVSMVPNSYSYKKAILLDHHAVIQTLVLGSSHEFEGVNTDLFTSSAVNLALPSQSLAQSADLGVKFLDRLPRLRHVLLGVSYYSLPYGLAHTGERWRLGFYMRAFGVFREATVLDVVNPANYSYIGIYGPAAVQSMIRTGFTVDYVGQISPTGFHGDGAPPPPLPADAPPISFEANARDRASFHHSVEHSENVSPNLEAMQRLAERCANRGITLTLFTAPVTNEYALAFGEAEWRSRRAVIEAFATRVHVMYVDYSRDAAFTWSDFANADHLNARGAAKFAHKLDAEIR
jgi:hypothetical protein